MIDDDANNRPEQLQTILLDNAIDFLLSAAEAVRRDEGARSLKEAVLHLANGIELMMKARLAREHWSLIFADVDKADYDQIAAGEFHSVDYGKTLDRLNKIVGVTVGSQSKGHLSSLRKQRNRLTHFTATLDPAQTKSLVAKGMTFCVAFCEEQGIATPEAETTLGEIHKNLAELQEFVDARMEAILKAWSDSVIWECPECWQQALVIDGGDVDCKFCRRLADPIKLAQDNTEGHVADCPECGEEQTLAFVLYNNDAGTWMCFSCGTDSEHYDHCMRCDLMDYFPDDDDVKICTSCWEYISKRG